MKNELIKVIKYFYFIIEQNNGRAVLVHRGIGIKLFKQAEGINNYNKYGM